MAVDGHGLSEDELALLTDEERAGLIDNDDGDDGDDDDAGDDADEGEGNSADTSKDDGSADTDAIDDKDADTADKAGKAGEADDDDDTAPAPAATGDRLDPADVKTRIDQIATQKDELDAKLDDGEITTKEYRVELEKLTGEQNKLSSDLARQEDADQAIINRWYADVNKFMDKNPELKANETRLASFDAVVRRVTGDPENASLSNLKQLQKARDIWREEMGFNDKAKTDPAPDPKPKPKPKTKPDLPPTLHNLPAADINDADDGKYSHLDALLNAGRTIEYEDALARMSEAEQQDYLSRA